jgi:hypothetical protein
MAKWLHKRSFHPFWFQQHGGKDFLFLLHWLNSHLASLSLTSQPVMVAWGGVRYDWLSSREQSWPQLRKDTIPMQIWYRDGFLWEYYSSFEEIFFSWSVLILLNLISDLQQPKNCEIYFIPWKYFLILYTLLHLKKENVRLRMVALVTMSNTGFSSWQTIAPQSPNSTLFFIIQGTGYEGTGHNCCFKVFSGLQLTYFFLILWVILELAVCVLVALGFLKVEEVESGFQKASSNERD